jgi:hypothetical protein
MSHLIVPGIALTAGLIAGFLLRPRLSSVEQATLSHLKTVLADLKTDALKDVADLESAKKTLLVIANRITSVL